VKHPVRNETSLIFVVAVIFSAIAIPVLSGFLDPSPPPAVAAVQIGDPRDRSVRDVGAPARGPEARVIEKAPASAKRSRPTQPAPAQPAPAEDLAEDDGGEAD
jgi:hypothetical protein